MKKLVLVSIAFGLSLLAGWLIASPALLGATTIIVSRESRSLPTGIYVNVDAGYGSAELALFANGRYTYGDDGSVSAEGTYDITGNRITFIEFGPADAQCLHLRGTYKWEVKSKTLTLTEVEDQCSTRQYDWKSGEWLRTRP